MLRRRCQFSLPTKRDESVFFVFSDKDRHLSSESMKSDSLGQLILTGAPGPGLDAAAEKLFRLSQPGGFILFARNFESAPQLRKLIADFGSLSEVEPIITIDLRGS